VEAREPNFTPYPLFVIRLGLFQRIKEFVKIILLAPYPSPKFKPKTRHN
jgi:hypothetical protein